MENPFKKRPALSPSGTETADDIYLAVGRALSIWENTEGVFAHLFGYLIKPAGNSFAARRAYGSVISGRARSTLILEAANVFFRNFPSDEGRAHLDETMAWYGDATARRNDIAHGQLMPSGPTSGHKGHYLAASVYTTKRSIRLQSPYWYTADDINRLTQEFSRLGGKADSLMYRLREPWLASPETQRERH